MIRNEDYEAEEARRGGDRMHFVEMKNGILRNAIKTEDEKEAILEAFTDKAIRIAFMKKVYGLLTIQLAITVAIIAFYIYGIPIVQCGLPPADNSYSNDTGYQGSSSYDYEFEYTGEYGGSQSAYDRCVQGIDLTVYVIISGVASLLGLALIIPIACCKGLRTSFPTNYILLFGFTICEGLGLGVVGIVYTPESILLAGGVTFGIVLTLTIFAFQTKIDFTACRGVMLCVLMVFFLCGIIMIFIPYSRIIEIVYGGIGATIFSVYLIIDTQMMMGGNHKYSISPEEYVFAAVAIYLDILNIFLYLLRIFGQRK